MKLINLAVLLAASSVVSAGNFFQQKAGDIFLGPSTNTGKQVPGESPLFFCGDTSNDIATIESVNLIPNPPVPGQTLEITAVGVLHDVIVAGAKVDVTVKYGLITLLKESLDLCDHVEEVDLKCPIDQGKLVLQKSVDIPQQVPPGQYTVVANAYTSDKRPITCLTATIKLNM